MYKLIRYFDLLLRFLATKTLKLSMYLSMILLLVVIARAAYNIFEIFEPYNSGEVLPLVIRAILYLILCRFVYFAVMWLKSMNDLEAITRDRYISRDFGYTTHKEAEARERLDEIKYLRRMTLSYFHPKFWFLNEKDFQKDKEKFSNFVNKIKNKDPMEDVDDEFRAFLEKNIKSFQTRRAIYSAPSFHEHFLDEEIQEYIDQIKASITADEYWFSEDKRKTSLKKRIANQKKLIELIKKDKRQFLIDAIYRFYCEKYRHRKMGFQFDETDLMIEYNLDSETNIRIDSSYISWSSEDENFNFMYSYVFDDEDN